MCKFYLFIYYSQIDHDMASVDGESQDGNKVPEYRNHVASEYAYLIYLSFPGGPRYGQC